ncbi:hypothetical protein GP486_007601 [Trichoglossum hirsutum]|uniref:Uncharacterized protein n=1 Tax=Trichoglossum hirsutum TaxID=265104 RepID=A0A9P8L4R7_9PEZI|nr:hypothetical protein GP486_007601 [Trichoglossum hirsutum]
MPTFHSLSTSVQLSVPKVFRTPTTDSSTRQPTDNSGGRLEGFQRAEDVQVLSEESLIGSDILEFLGEGKDMPFFLVRAGRDLLKPRLETGGAGSSVASRQLPLEPPSPGQTRSPATSPPGVTSGDEPAVGPEMRRSSFGRLIKRKGSPLSGHTPVPLKTPEPVAAASTRIAPLPLTLTVTLHPPGQRLGADDPRKKAYPQDIKVDVFLNGEFTASRVIPVRHRDAGWSKVSEVFSGRRIALKRERVWVLVPPGQNADGTLREPKRVKNVAHSAAERWAEIGRALQEESGRWGQGKSGESCVKEYLQHLATTVKLPKGLEHIQKPDGQKFSTMDVVVSLGKVGKRELNYLRGPERSTDPRFSKSSEENSKNDAANQTNLFPSAPSPVKEVASSDDRLAPQNAASSYSTSKAVVPPRPPSPPPFRRNIPKSFSAPTFRRSSRKSRTLAVAPPAFIPDPVKLNKRYSAEQNRRLQDLTLIPARPRQENTIIPADLSHSHPAPVSLTPATPFTQSIKENTTAIPIGGPENTSQKRHRSSNEKPLETQPKKRRSKMGDLSSTLNESIWGSGAVTTTARHGAALADAPAMSTRSRGRSHSVPVSDRNVLGATATGNLGRSSRPPSRGANAAEPQTPRETRYPNGLTVDNNLGSSAQPNAPGSTELNSSSKTEGGPPRPMVDRNALVVRLPEPIDFPSPNDWRPSPLSRDAVLTYAEGNAWESSTGQQIQRVVSDIPVKSGDVAYQGEKMDGVREVRMERPASFETEGILMGVRFVVG